MKQIKNYVSPVDGAPATAGQPTEDQLRIVAAGGMALVINLGLLDPKYCLPDEAGFVRRLGMTYHHIPVAFDAPTREQLDRLMELLRDADPVRTLVHCAANYRATCFVALYGERVLGWSRRRADEYIERIWSPDEVWTRFLEVLRSESNVDQRPE